MERQQALQISAYILDNLLSYKNRKEIGYYREDLNYLANCIIHIDSKPLHVLEPKEFNPNHLKY